jgi:hypothetical protein
MKTYSKVVVDEFVSAINRGKREPGMPDEIPASVRLDEPGPYGTCHWKIVPIHDAPWLKPALDKLPKRLPPSFMDLVSRYSFPAFKTRSCFFFANTGEHLDYELCDKWFVDGHLSSLLLKNGLVQFGNPFMLNYDPVCMDTRTQHPKTLDCPVVVLDHEEILVNSRLHITRTIAPSFCELLRMITEGYES